MEKNMKKLRRIFIIITAVLAIITISCFSLYIIARNNNADIIIIDMELARK